MRTRDIYRYPGDSNIWGTLRLTENGPMIAWRIPQEDGSRKVELMPMMGLVDLHIQARNELGSEGNNMTFLEKRLCSSIEQTEGAVEVDLDNPLGRRL